MTSRGRRLGWIILVAALYVPAAVAAQVDGTVPGSCPGYGRMRGSGPGMMRGGGRHFDANAVTTIQGRVLDVQRIARGRHEGVHLSVAMGSEKLAVFLGPAFYVDAQPLKVAQGDLIEVKGARMTLNGQAVIIAQEVRRGDQALALRDADGVPLWRGQGMASR